MRWGIQRLSGGMLASARAPIAASSPLQRAMACTVPRWLWTRRRSRMTSSAWCGSITVKRGPMMRRYGARRAKRNENARSPAGTPPADRQTPRASGMAACYQSVTGSVRPVEPPPRAPSGALLGGLDLTSYGPHVEVADRADQLLERGLRKGAGLTEDEDAVAERHQGRDRRDPEGASQTLLGLGVDAAERDVGVGLRGLLVDRGEHPARTAPGRPEVDQHDPVTGDGGLEVLLGQGRGGHRIPSARVLVCW